METMKRVLSAFLALVMIFGMIPAPAFATEVQEAAEEFVGEEVSLIEETEPEETLEEETQPEKSQPEESQPEESQAEEAPVLEEYTGEEAPETQPEETQAEETEPQQTSHTYIPLELLRDQYVLTEQTYSSSETVTVTQEVEKDLYETREVTEENSGTILAMVEVTDSSAAMLGSAETTFDSFAALKSLLESGTTGELLYNGTDVLMIEEDFTIPAGVTVKTNTTAGQWEYAEYWYEGTGSVSVDIPSDVTLTVNGSLQVAGLCVSGTMNVNGLVRVDKGLVISEGSRLNLTHDVYVTPGSRYNVYGYGISSTTGKDLYWHHGEINTTEEFENAVNWAAAHQDGYIHRIVWTLENDCSIFSHITVPQRVFLTIESENGSELTLEPGFSLSLYNSSTTLGAITNIKGSLNNQCPQFNVHNWLTFEEGSTLEGEDLFLLEDAITNLGNGDWRGVISGLSENYNAYVLNGTSYRRVSARRPLPNPFNLQWGKKLGDNGVVSQVGNVYWEVDPQNDSYSYNIAIFNVNNFAVPVEYIEYRYGMIPGISSRSLPHFTFQPRESGEYVFAVTMVPTNSETSASETVFSPVWKYKKPSKTLGVPENLSTAAFPMMTWDIPANGTADTMYYVEYQFSPTGEEGSYQNCQYTNFFSSNSSRVSRQMTDAYGAGFYRFRVKAVSENMNQKNTGEFSGWSDPIYWDTSSGDTGNYTYVNEAYFDAVLEHEDIIFLDQPMMLQGSYTIPSGVTLVLRPGGELVIPYGSTLTAMDFVCLDGGNLTLDGGTLTLNNEMEIRVGSAFNYNGGSMNFGKDGLVKAMEFDNEARSYIPDEVPYENRGMVHVVVDPEKVDEVFEEYQRNQAQRYAHVVLSWRTNAALPENTVLGIGENDVLELVNTSDRPDQEPVVMKIPESVTVQNFCGRIIVNPYCTIENYGELLQSGSMNVQGKLHNEGLVRVRTGVSLPKNAFLGIRDGGLVNNMGSVEVNAQAILEREPMSGWTGTEPRYVYENFRTQLNNANKNGGKVTVRDHLIILEDLTFSAKAELELLEGGVLEVAPGVTLTLNGSAQVGGYIKVHDGGKLVVNQDIHMAPNGVIAAQEFDKITVAEGKYVWIDYLDEGLVRSDIPSEYKAFKLVADESVDDSTIENLLWDTSNNGRVLLEVKKVWVPVDSDVCVNGNTEVTICDGYGLYNNTNFTNYGKITVEKGAVLTNYGEMSQYGELLVKGTMNNGDTSPNVLCLYNGSTTDISGTMDNVGIVPLETGAKLICSGTWEGALPVNNGGVMEGAAFSMTQAQLKKLMEQPGDQTLTKAVRLSSNMTLNERLILDVGGVLQVPKGVTLTVNGGLLLEGGSVFVEAGGKLVQQKGNDYNIYVSKSGENYSRFIFDDEAEYVRGEGAEIHVLMHEGMCDLYSRAYYVNLDTYLLTAWFREVEGADTVDSLFSAYSEEYEQVLMELDNFYLAEDESLYIPYNGKLILDAPSFDDAVNNGTIYVNPGSFFQINARYGVPSYFRNNGTIYMNGEMSLCGNMDNQGMVRVTGRLGTNEKYGRDPWEGNDIILASGYTNAPEFSISLAEFKAQMKELPEGYGLALNKLLVVDSDLTLDRPVNVKAGGALRVVNGATLTVKQGLTIEDDIIGDDGYDAADLYVESGSTLKNVGYERAIDIRSLPENNGYVSIYGEYTGMNLVSTVTEAGVPDISGVDTNLISGVYDYIITDPQDFADALSYPYFGQSYITLDDMTLSGKSLTIPEHITVNAAGKLSLDSDTVLNVYGQLNVSDLVVGSGCLIHIQNGGYLSYSGQVTNNGEVNCAYNGGLSGPEETWTGSYPNWEADWDYREFLADLNNAEESYTLNSTVVLQTNLILGDPAFTVGQGGQLVVPSGVTLTAKDLTILGGTVVVYPGGTLKVTGDLKVDNSMDGTLGQICVFAGSGKIPNAKFINNGNILVGQENKGGAILCYGTYSGNKINVCNAGDGYVFVSSTIRGIDRSRQNLLMEIVAEGQDYYEIASMFTDAQSMGFGDAHLTLTGSSEYHVNEWLYVSEGYTLESDGVIYVNGGADIWGNVNADLVNNSDMWLYDTAVIDGDISGYAPKVHGAVVKPMATGMSVTSVNQYLKIDGSKITINVHDAREQYINWEDGESNIRLDIDVQGGEETPSQLVNITSSNQNVLSNDGITHLGNGIYALSLWDEGTTTLTITTVASKSVSKGRGVPVTQKFTLTVETPKADTVTLYTENDNGLDNEPGSHVLGMRGKPQTFRVYANLYDYQDRYIDPETKTITWSTSDKSLATVQAAGYNSALVTVPAGASGYATITAQVKGEAAGTLDLTVEDRTPRLGSAKFEVNPYLWEGAAIDLVESHGEAITAVAADSGDLVLRYDSESNKLYVTSRDANLPKQTIKTTLHVYTDYNGVRDEYVFPITVTVKPSLPKVTVKQVGKMDLFYTDIVNELTVTAAGGAEVAYVELSGTEDFDYSYDANALAFGGKLLAEYPDNAKYKIDNKADIAVTLVGYRVPVLVKNFKISTTTSKPAIELVNSDGETSTKINKHLHDYYTLQLTARYKGGEDLIPSEINGGPVFMDGFHYEEYIEKDMDGNMPGKTVTITVREDNWMRPVTVSHKFTVDSKLPTLKLKTSTLKLNSHTPSVASTVFTTSYPVDWVNFWEDPVCTKGNQDEAAKIRLEFVDNEFTATYDQGNAPKPGTYKFKVTPLVGMTKLKSMDVTVKVDGTTPKAALKQSTVKLYEMLSDEPTVLDLDLKGETLAHIQVNKSGNSKIDLYMDGEEVKVRFFNSSDLPAAKTYSFQFTPYYYDANGELTAMNKLTVKVQVVGKPKAILKTDTVAFSPLLDDTVKSVELALDQEDLEIVSVEFTPTGKNALKNNELFLNCTEDNMITVEHYLGDQVKPGTYTYNLTVQAKGSIGQVEELAPVKLTVKLLKDTDKPTVALKSSSIKLNSQLATYESVTVPMTWTDKTGADFLSKGIRKIQPVYLDWGWLMPVVDEDGNITAVSIALNENAVKGKKTVTMTPYIDVIDGEDIILKDISLKVEITDKKPTVTAKTSGKLDVLNRDQGMTFTVTKLSNLPADVTPDQVMYVELEDEGLFQVESLDFNAKGQLTFALKLWPGVTYDLKKTYKVTVCYVFDSGLRVEMPYSIKLTQSSVKMAAKQPSLTYYLSGDEIPTVEAYVTSPAKFDMSYVAAVDKSTSKELLTAMGLKANQEITLDTYYESEESGSIASYALNLVRPSALKNGKTYKLVLNHYPEGYALNSKPVKITYNIKIVK